jgi:hypothetical protein
MAVSLVASSNQKQRINQVPKIELTTSFHGNTLVNIVTPGEHSSKCGTKWILHGSIVFPLHREPTKFSGFKLCVKLLYMTHSVDFCSVVCRSSFCIEFWLHEGACCVGLELEAMGFIEIRACVRWSLSWWLSLWWRAFQSVMITLIFMFIFLWCPTSSTHKKNGARHFGKMESHACGCFIFQNAMKVLILCITLSNALEKFKEVIMKNVMFAYVDIFCFWNVSFPLFSYDMQRVSWGNKY